MKIIIETVTNSEDTDAMWQIRRDVFERELGIMLAPPEISEKNAITHLLARVAPGREAIGTMSLIDTSGNQQLHASCGLNFEFHARVARYTHLAVLKPYRGMNIPLMMMLEAHRRIIVPQYFDYTWLLFDVERASTSFLCKRLGFTQSAGTFVSEYGCRCPLVRDEHLPQAVKAVEQAEQYLKQYKHLSALTEVAHTSAAISA